MKNKLIFFLALTPFSVFSQPVDFVTENEFNIFQAESLVLLEKLNNNAQCYISLNKPSGYQSSKIDNFVFSKSSMMKKPVICFDSEKAYMSSSNSTYVRILDNSFISAHISDKFNAEVVETIQLDKENNKIKYTKSINYLDENSQMSKLGGTLSMISDMFKIK